MRVDWVVQNLEYGYAVILWVVERGERFRDGGLSSVLSELLDSYELLVVSSPRINYLEVLRSRRNGKWAIKFINIQNDVQ